MKKKKKMDPQILKAREERKKKRIEKSIKKLEKNVKQLKPIEEIDLTINLQKEKL
jgi:large subunit ribosomal protein L40